jgi:PAS domain S-box-containing protein
MPHPRIVIPDSQPQGESYAPPPDFPLADVSCHHTVQFYEDERFLCDAVVDFLSAGLQAGQPAVVIATEAHRRAFSEGLAARGFSPDTLRQSRLLIFQDAAGLLASFMGDTLPDAARFHQAVRAALAEAKRDYPPVPVRVFGEMVDLLWKAGRPEAALRLEQLWNELAATESFSLLCAYPISAFGSSADTDHLEKICLQHRQVLPAEPYRLRQDEEERNRDVVQLQQRAAALETEIARSHELDAELQDFFENATEGLYRIGPDGTILWANRAHLELLGCSPEECIGHHVAKFHADASVIQDILARLARNENLSNYEARLRCKDGSIKYVLLSSNIRWAEGQLAYARIFTRDITERRRTDEARAWLAAIVDSSDDAIVSKTLDGIITSWNRAAERMFGYTAAEAVGQSITLIIPDDRIAEEEHVLSRLRAGLKIDHFETVRRTKDGRLLNISLTVSPIRNAHGEVIGASKVARDITERHRMAAAIRDREQRLHQLLSLLPAAVYTCDADGRITFYNRRASELWGREPAVGEDEQRFCGAYRLWRPDGSPLVHSDTPMAQALRDGTPTRHGEVVIERPDGTRVTVSVNVDPLRDAAGRPCGAINVFEDITFRKLAEEKLESAVAERTASLQQAVAQMEEFSYSVSHDLRAPLRSMFAYAEALLEDYSGALDEAGKEYLAQIMRGAQRMEQLSRDMLTYSRLARSEITFTEVNLQNLVRDLIQQYVEFQSPKAEIFIEEPLPGVLAHEPSLGQCIANLLTNAVKFVAPGTPPRVRIYARPRGEHIRLFVEDNGIGIPPQYHQRIFNIFERLCTEDQYEGTGIGLAMVRKAMERMNAQYGVESDGVHGARFWLELRKA